MNTSQATGTVVLALLSGVGEFLSIPGSGIFLGFILGFASSFLQLRFLCQKCEENRK